MRNYSGDGLIHYHPEVGSSEVSTSDIFSEWQSVLVNYLLFRGGRLDGILDLGDCLDGVLAIGDRLDGVLAIGDRLDDVLAIGDHLEGELRIGDCLDGYRVFRYETEPEKQVGSTRCTALICVSLGPICTYFESGCEENPGSTKRGSLCLCCAQLMEGPGTTACGARHLPYGARPFNSKV
ncbi:hypothetical protein JCGZ_10600 [Jatropha curcas]|uniref:Uncharacterized protein n=1 Tax=Jatropha curcas TaxID=180498 RepID=A0A067KI10_JATCU|nr:hypothetical protein JCGZ_10600 [Jatropha curcas]